jgi:kynurenine 3-monooxygenase
MDNYHEIHSDIRHPTFLLQKQVERELMHRYKDRYVSKHVLVMFTNTPYARAQALGKVQAQLLEKICSTITEVGGLDWQEIDKLMLNYDKNLTKFS